MRRAVDSKTNESHDEIKAGKTNGRVSNIAINLPAGTLWTSPLWASLDFPGLPRQGSLLLGLRRLGRRVKIHGGLLEIRLRLGWGRLRVLRGGLLTQPFRFHQILEELRERAAAFAREFFRPYAKIRMDGQVDQFSPVFQRYGFSGHSILGVVRCFFEAVQFAGAASGLACEVMSSGAKSFCTSMMRRPGWAKSIFFRSTI